MAVSTLDIVDDVYAAISNSSLKTAITGGVYKQSRPLNSLKEDIVINSLPVNNNPLQEAVVNVNIHAANLSVVVNGATDNSKPDWVRLKALATLALPVLASMWQGGWHFELQQQSLIEDGDSHFINIRLEFYSLNISN